MKRSLLVILLFSFAVANAQEEKTFNRKSVEAYEKALLKLRDGQIKEAIPDLRKAVELDSTYYEPALSLANVYGQIKEYQLAVNYFDKAYRLDSSRSKYFLWQYANSLGGLTRFEDALKAINKFITIPDISEKNRRNGLVKKSNYQFAIDYAAKHPTSYYTFDPINLGDSVNSPQSEYYPSVTIDDTLLVFTRRGQGIREDFMKSSVHGDKYAKAKVIDGSINDEPSKGGVTVSADGEWMIFAGNFGNQKGFGDFDLYLSRYTPNGWSEPENLGPNINTEFWESSPSLSPDKRVLYFSSNRNDGEGGKDLYMSIREPNGKFGQAINMGDVINSTGDEQAPYIHADNQTLYYTSDGLPGYGSADIFVIRKDPTGKWGEPQNLGYPINTIDHEGSLAVSADGTTAFYATDRIDSRGQLDLYKFLLRDDIRPYRTLYVKGKVYDKKTNKGLPSTVGLIDNANNNTLMKIQTDETGTFLVTLPLGKNYTFTVNRKGYLFYSELYELNKKQADSVYHKDIALQPVELNANVVLKNIQFESNAYKLLPISMIELDNLLEILKENTTLKVEISGHSDNTGNAAENIKLSTYRAKSVVDYLISKGISPTRLTYKGYGSAKPIADNKTEEGKSKNRRTEFTVIGM